jgi:predicted enzyme related to lactoylglutathione lyase
MSSETSKDKPSNFVWYELHTFDAAGAETFYRNVVGWGAEDAGMPGKAYTLLTAGKTAIGGVLAKPAGDFVDGAKPGWMGYIGVNDIDGFTSRVLKAGGVLHRAAEDIPGVGRFSVVADPQGAIFVLFAPTGGRQAELPPAGTPGTFAWHDLAAAEWQSDFDFYSNLFGWSKAGALDMGAAGTYQIFAAGDVPLGGMMTRTDKAQAPGWLYYVNVEDIDAAVSRAVDGGGKLTHGPSTVPGGQRIAHCLDPQGAIFGMVAPGK